MTRTAEDNAVEFGVLSKQGKDLRLALLAACSVEKDTGHGGKRSNQNVSKISARAFASKAGTAAARVLRHLEAWDAFAKKAKLPLAAKLTPGDATDLDLTDQQAALWETIVLSENNRGTRVTPTSVAAAVKTDPKVAAAATQALVDKGDIDTLSKATAAVAKNRQVERNRRRVTSGLPKGTTVQDPKPTLGDPGLSAFMSVNGLAEALRALVTTFPKEWAALSDTARGDEDFVGSCEETLDKIEIAVANLRSLISGGASVDKELAKLLEGSE